MSNLSPFLQAVEEKLSEAGANPDEINVVKDAAQNDIDIAKQACSDLGSGWYWDSKDNICKAKVDEDVPVEEPVVEEPVVEEVVEEQDEVEKVEAIELPRDKTRSLLLNSKTRKFSEKEQQEYYDDILSKTNSEDIFFVKPEDLAPFEKNFWSGQWEYNVDGDKTKFSEDEAVKWLSRKFNSLGIPITEEGFTTDKIKIGDVEVSMGGLWTDLWNTDTTNIEKAEAINDIITEILIQKQNPEHPSYDPNFDQQHYMDAYKVCELISEHGNDSEMIELLSLHDLRKDRDIAYQQTMSQFFKTEKGLEVRSELQVQRIVRELEIQNDQIRRFYLGEIGWDQMINETAVLHNEMLEDIYMNHPEIEKVLYNTSAVFKGFYDKDIKSKVVQEKLRKEYGALAENDLLVSFVKGFHVTWPKERLYAEVANNAAKLQKLKEPRLVSLDATQELKRNKELTIHGYNKTTKRHTVELNELDPNMEININDRWLKTSQKHGVLGVPVSEKNQWEGYNILWNDPSDPQWMTIDYKLKERKKELSESRKGTSKYIKIEAQIESLQEAVDNGNGQEFYLETNDRFNPDGLRKPIPGTYRDLGLNDEGTEIVTKPNTLTIQEINTYRNSFLLWKELKLNEKVLKTLLASEKADSLSNPHAAFLDSEGNININSENYAEAIGDQGFRMLTSIFSGTMTSFVTETANIMENKLQKYIQDSPHASNYNTLLVQAQNTKDPEEKAMINAKIGEIMMECLNEMDLDSVFVGGGISGSLDAVSNVLFLKWLKPAAKPVIKNISHLFKVFMKGEFKVGIRAMIHGGKNLGKTSITEKITEGTQELVQMVATDGPSLNELPTWAKNADYQPVFNAMLTAFLTTPVIQTGTKTFNSFKSSFNDFLRSTNNPEHIKSKTDASREEASRQYRNGEIDLETYEQELRYLNAADRMFDGLPESAGRNWQDKESLEELLEKTLEQVKLQEQFENKKITEKDLEDKYGPNWREMASFATDQEAEAAMLLENIDEIIQDKINLAHFEWYQTHGRNKINKLNNDPKLNKRWEGRIFKNNKQVVDYLKKLSKEPGNEWLKHPKAQKAYNNFLTGKANGFVFSIEEIKEMYPGYKGRGVCFINNQAVRNNIAKGKIYSSNAVHHEIEHIFFMEKFPVTKKGNADLKKFRQKLEATLQDSQNPLMQKIYQNINIRMLDYIKTKDSRILDEEFLCAFGDVTTALNIEYSMLNPDIHKAFQTISNEFRMLLDPDSKVNSWNTQNTFEFLSGFKSSIWTDINERRSQFARLVPEIDDDGNITFMFSNDLTGITEDVINLPDNSYTNFDTRFSIVDKGDYDLYRQTVSSLYPGKRSPNQIKEENKNLADKIIEAESYTIKKKNGKYILPDGRVISEEEAMKLQNSIRENASKEYRTKLIWNNWGSFENFINAAWKTDIGLDLIGGNRDQFLGKCLEEFIKATATYDPKENDSFNNYFFSDRKNEQGKFIPNSSIASLRIPKILDGLSKLYTTPVDPNPDDGKAPTTDELIDYQENELDASTTINNAIEYSALRKSIIESGIEFEVDGPNYTKFMDAVRVELNGYDMSKIFNPESSQDLRNLGKNLWKVTQGMIKDGGKLNQRGEPTQLYKDFINATVETLYNQMGQKEFNKLVGKDLDLFTEIIEARATKETFDELKAVEGKPKDPRAGNTVRKKKEFTDEIRDLFLDKLLKTSQIEGLKNAALYEKKDFQEYGMHEDANGNPKSREVEVTLKNNRKHKGSVKITKDNLILTKKKKKNGKTITETIKIPWNDIESGKLTNAGIHSIVRIDMIQESTLKNYSSVLFNDAVMQTITSEGFREENGIATAQIAQAGLLLDKGMDVRFQYAGEEKLITLESLPAKYKDADGVYNGQLHQQDVNEALKAGEAVFGSHDDLNKAISAVEKRAKELGLDEGSIDLIASLFDKGHVLSADQAQYTSMLKKDDDLSAEWKPIEVFKSNPEIIGLDGKPIKLQDEMFKTASYIANHFGLDIMNLTGFEIVGFKGGRDYLDTTKGSKKYYQDNNGTSPFYEPFEKLKKALKSKDHKFDDDFDINKIEPIYNGSKLHNEVKALQERGFNDDGSIMTREQKIEEYNRKNEAGVSLADRVDAANKANRGIHKFMINELRQLIQDKKINPKALAHIFKLSSSTTKGWRAFATLDLMLWADGEQVIDKVEHTKAISQLNAQIVKLLADSSNYSDSEFNIKLNEVLAEYSIISGSEKHFEVLDKEGGRTNEKATQRLNIWDEETKALYSNGKGKSTREVQAELIISKEIAISQDRSRRRGKIKEQIASAVEKGEAKSGSVVDFDDTLNIGNYNFVLCTLKDKAGNIIDTKKVISGDFHSEVKELTEAGWEFDFNDFATVRGGRKGPYFEQLKALVEEHGSDAIFILTARQPEAAVGIQMWLEQNGINIPLENITGLGADPNVVIGPKDKANWIEDNLLAKMYNKILFADDSKKNNAAVKQLLFEIYGDVIDPKSRVDDVDPTRYSLTEDNEQSNKNFLSLKDDGSIDLSTTMNNIVELESGVRPYIVLDAAEAELRGRKKGKRLVDFIMPPSAYDFEMFIYRYLGKGDIGIKQKQFFQDKLLTPFAEGTKNLNTERVRVKRKKKKLFNDPNNKEIISKLDDIIVDEKLFPLNKKGKPTTNMSIQQAIRVYLWTENKIKIPGISPELQEKLHFYVKNNVELRNFANKVSILTDHPSGYVKPSDYWHTESINHDLQNLTRGVNRERFFLNWVKNKNEIFSPKNLLQLREAYGNKHVEALEDMLYRMEYGQGKRKKGRIETEWDNWVNNSVGSIMFLNTKSALLQTISAANYLNWGDNNILAASARFADIKQFSKDFAMIWSSDLLVSRRDGEQRGIVEAELAKAVAQGKSPQAVVSWLLQKGFLPTQIADSFAISLGGAAFYRNRINSYIKDNPDWTLEKCKNRAWLDFQELTNQTQQSSREDLISQQQAGGLGRLILAFKNTPMQYNRRIFKAGSDLYNMRVEDPKQFMSKMSEIAYYGVVQNAMFTFLQRALWKQFEDEGEEWDESLIDGMVENFLGGFGITGQLMNQITKSYKTYREERKKGYNADHAKTIIDFVSISPTIGSKLRDLYSATQTEKFNQDVINDMGFDINNPAMNAIGNLLSATLNLPVDEVVQKTQNIMMIVNANRKPVGEKTTISIIDTDPKSKTFGEEITVEVEGKGLDAEGCEIEFKDQIALLLGYNPWELGLETPSRKRREELKEEKNQNKINEQVEQDKEKQENQKEKGEEITNVKCAARTSEGSRCKNDVAKAGDLCLTHMSKEERKKAPKCKYIKPNGEQCKNPALNGGYCNVKQHQPGYKKK